MSLADIDDLIKCYFSVCNKALDLNKERFPFKQILGAAKASEKGRQVEARVSDHPDAVYVIEIKQGVIASRPHVDCEDCNCVRGWCVTKNYLEDVVKNPQIYIGNPAKINWEWMYDD